MNLKNLLLFTFFLFVFNDLFAQAWNFIKEEDGVKLYTRKEDGSNLKSFKGIMDVTATMDKVTNLIGNVYNHNWWDENLREIKVLAYQKDKYFQYYLVYGVPWPFTDRDLCVEAQMTIDPVTGKRTIYATPLNNVIPEKHDVVRIKNYWQRWTVQPMENGVIRLTLEGFVDPGGNVPSWLYNMVIVDTPLKVMRRVKKFVQ
ncbi:MAG: START domain-containing protein [Bacteroidetes bacterium]|nr:START domain-containing protein [Bacteroidota bacterium]